MAQLSPTALALLTLALFVSPAAGLPQVGGGSSTPTPPRASAPAALLVDLDVDADRDGVVEVIGADDDAGEHLWSAAKGAVFLYNNDDDDGDGAVDAADSVVNGAADALDLAPVRLRPIRGVPSAWTGVLMVDGAAMPWVRLFREQPDRWRELMLRGMNQDWSWDGSARLYIDVYRAALEKRAMQSAPAAG